MALPPGTTGPHAQSPSSRSAMTASLFQPVSKLALATASAEPAPPGKKAAPSGAGRKPQGLEMVSAGAAVQPADADALRVQAMNCEPLPGAAA